ncbi:hypothetical protein ApDm4_1787 [Acetobacter pomorum]|nr:hypothetical protein ApDm4_1787 [Acetobacter pomorum]
MRQRGICMNDIPMPATQTRLIYYSIMNPDFVLLPDQL